MAFVPLPGGIRVAMEYRLDGQVVLNIYHVKYSEPIVTGNLTSVLDLFLDWWSNNMADNFSSDIALVKLTAQAIDVEDGEILEMSLETPVPGTNALDSLPNNCAFCVSDLTNRTGRSYRGRHYYAGIPEAWVTNNTLDSAHYTALIASVVELYDSIAGDSLGGNVVIASFVTNGAPRTEAIGTLITGVGGDDTMDSQRRRLPKRGA